MTQDVNTHAPASTATPAATENGAAGHTDSGPHARFQELKAAAGELDAAVEQYTATDVSPSGVKDMQAIMAKKKDVIDAAVKILGSVMEPTDQWFAWAGEVGKMAALRLLWDWGVFDAMPAEGTITYAELATKTETEQELLTRVAHVLVANGMLVQTPDGQVGHSRLSRTLMTGDASGLIFHMTWENAFVPYGRYPDYFRQYGRKEPQTVNHVPTTFAYNCPQYGFYEMLQHDPPRMKRFAPAMEAIEARMPIAGIYDLGWVVAKAEGDEATTSRPLFVDVGGGQGQAIIAIHHEFPGLPLNRCVLQDRPEVIEYVEKAGGEEIKQVSKVGIDFHKEQPTHGALIYWIRRCFHNYGDDIVTNMLRIIAGAMAPDSRILIEEDILDDPPAQMAAMLDIMMLGFGGKQRSLATWDRVLGNAGLKVSGVSKGRGPWAGLGVLECVKK